MKLEEIKELLGAEVKTGEEMLDKEVVDAAAADLMSDVLANVKPEALLITGLVNAQVLHVADLAEIGGLVFVRGKHVTEEIIQTAKEKNIPVLWTTMRMFEACGKLYSAGRLSSPPRPTSSPDR